MLNIKNSILAGILFGLMMGVFFAIRFDIHNGLIAGPISGLAFGIILYFFVTSKTVEKQTQIENLDGKPIIHCEGANYFVNGEAIGGKLYLLTDKIQFQSHTLNIQNQGQIINIEQIKEVRFYNTFGLIPNGLAITTQSGRTEKFVVNNRRLLKEEIEKLINKNI